VDALVVSEQEVDPRREEGDTAETRVTIAGPRLEQRVIRFAPGRSSPRSAGGRQEILYVVAGSGVLHIGEDAHALEPETGAFLLPGETHEIEALGPDPLVVVSVLAPAERALERREVTVRFADREELRADEKRTFRVLVSADSGCFDVTQFVGIVEPCRAPDHSHPYDEVGYIVEGVGVAHLGATETPIGPGSCFHLPPGSVHCIENSGPGVMRIMGVFHPSGSPKQRSYQATS
jgi:quercetin dioxygenase-like cupin family protein